MNQPKKFPPHGRLEISVEGNILLVEHWGPFNLEYWIEHRIKVAPFLKMLEEKGRFAVISVYYDSLLFPLEALELVTSQLALGEFLGPKCTCAVLVVGEQVDGRSLLLRPLTTRAKYLFGESNSPVVLNSIFDALDFAKESGPR